MGATTAYVSVCRNSYHYTYVVRAALTGMGGVGLPTSVCGVRAMSQWCKSKRRVYKIINPPARPAAAPTGAAPRTGTAPPGAAAQEAQAARARGH